jgi:hypothetical protein
MMSAGVGYHPSFQTMHFEWKRRVSVVNISGGLLECAA